MFKSRIPLKAKNSFLGNKKFKNQSFGQAFLKACRGIGDSVPKVLNLLTLKSFDFNL